jgi:hypothetical protein
MRKFAIPVDGLGFEIADRSIVDGEVRWCWLRLGNATLMLQQFPTEGHGAWVPTGRSAKV